MGVNFISHNIAFGRQRRPNASKWRPKNSTFFKKIAEWIWIDLALIFCMNDFFCVIVSLWDKIDFVFFFAALNRNLKLFLIFFYWWGTSPPSNPPPKQRPRISHALGLIPWSEQVSVNGIFPKATLRCFPAKCTSLRSLLRNVKYKKDNNSKIQNRIRKTHENKNTD